MITPIEEMKTRRKMTDIICENCEYGAEQHGIVAYPDNGTTCRRNEVQVLRAHIAKLEAAGRAVVDCHEDDDSIWFKSEATVLLVVNDQERDIAVAALAKLLPQPKVVMHLFPECRGCEYNPCDYENNLDYCPAVDRRPQPKA